LIEKSRGKWEERKRLKGLRFKVQGLRFKVQGYSKMHNKLFC
jgi:hypothetical protein